MSRFSRNRGIGPGWLLLGGLVLVIGIVFLVAPAWTCAPFRLSDLADPGELPPPLPPNCVAAADEPSDATMQALDRQREEMGLTLQGTVTCKVASSRAARAHGIDPRWLQCLYSGGVLRVKRHVLIATTQDVPGGTLFTVERCLMPWWKYIDESGNDCWSQVEFWK